MLEAEPLHGKTYRERSQWVPRRQRALRLSQLSPPGDLVTVKHCKSQQLQGVAGVRRAGQ